MQSVSSGGSSVSYGYTGSLLSSLTYGNDTYDANGLRATKTVNGTKSTYVYVNGLLTYEKRGDIEIYFWYDSYGHLMALRCFGVQDSNPYYYVLTNIQGDVLGIYNGEGQLKVSYEYDSWGNLINMTDTSGVNIGTINPIRYRGYYYDTETGLYYLQSRYYDPQVGRFINADAFVSTGQGLTGHNMFVYCGNNPVIYCDPTGEIAITTLIFVGSLIVGGAVALYSAYESRERGCDWVETFANAAIDGLCAFMTAYTFGMAGYECYYNMSMRYGYVPIIEVGLNSTNLNPEPEINSSTYVSRGSTATIQPSDLVEQLALEEVKSNPCGTEMKIIMNDVRWPFEEGWVKMEQHIYTSKKSINIHFLYNKNYNVYDDFKIKGVRRLER